MLFCNDVATARNWLGTAFGFETSATHQDADGRVFGAELRLGDARVMLLGGDDEAAMGMRSPRTIGSMTGGVYVTLDDVDGHYEQSSRAGATIVMPIQNMEYGSREYGALDNEGHYWGFGSYRPV